MKKLFFLGTPRKKRLRAPHCYTYILQVHSAVGSIIGEMNDIVAGIDMRSIMLVLLILRSIMDCIARLPSEERGRGGQGQGS